MPVPQPRPAFGGMAEEEALALTAVYTSIISIGQLEMDTDTAMGRTDPVQCLPVFNSARQATMLAHLVVEASESGGVDDVLAVQALAAIELWLYLSRNLRPAMHLSGTIGSESEPCKLILSLYFVLSLSLDPSSPIHFFRLLPLTLPLYHLTALRILILS